MPAPTATFIPDILEEHLEELAFLWGQRQTAVRDPRYTTREFTHLEERITAHLNAAAEEQARASEAEQAQSPGTAFPGEGPSAEPDHTSRGAPTLSACARDLLVRIRELTGAINGLEREVRSLAPSVAPSLLALTGCGHLTAAKLVGQTAGIGRFRSRAAFARHNGTAPVPVWSGNTIRHRLNRGGDRQLNVALHRIAITQLQREGPGRDYLAKRMAAGDTKTEAIRALRRRLSDEVFRRLLTDETERVRATTVLTAAAA